MADKRDRLDWCKDVTSVIQSVAATLAILGAGWWFLMQGLITSHANLTETVQSLKIHDKWRWVRLSVRITNVGLVPMRLHTGTAYVQRIYPLDDDFRQLLDNGESLMTETETKIPWHRISNPYAIELNSRVWPGESESYDVDFIVPSDLCEVMVHAFISNSADPSGAGWGGSTIQKIGEGACDK